MPSDEGHGAEAVLVLSYNYWRRSHGGDPDIVGKVFKMNDRPHTVIGVLPPIPQYPNENDVYMPTSACPTRSSEGFIANRNARMMSVFGRLKPDVPVEQAQADLDDYRQPFAASLPGFLPGQPWLSRDARFTARRTDAPGAADIPRLARHSGAGAADRLLQCRQPHAGALDATGTRTGITRRIGSKRARLIRQLLTESALLAIVGGGLGILLAATGLDLLTGFAARFTTRASEIKIDSSVLIFTLTVSLLTGLVFGLLPALSAKGSLAAAIKEGGAQSMRGTARHRLRSLLVVAQVAVSFTLLIGAGLMLRSFLKLQQVDPGFNPERVMVMRVNPNWSKYNDPSGQQLREFYRRVIEKTKTQPGILAAAMSNGYPLSASGNGPFNRNFQIEGHPPAENEPASRVDMRYASPDYFSTIRLPLITGRLFTEGDHHEAPLVIIVNQAMAQHRWGAEDPLGKRISFDRGEHWATVVGIVGDVRQYGLEQDHTDAVYVPVDQGGFAIFLLARTAAEPTSMVRQIRTAVRDIDPETAIDETTTLEQARSESLASSRLTTLLITLFALIALVITAAGIAGVMALSVTQRRHELGIRLALGATPASVLWMGLAARDGLRADWFSHRLARSAGAHQSADDFSVCRRTHRPADIFSGLIGAGRDRVSRLFCASPPRH